MSTSSSLTLEDITSDIVLISFISCTAPAAEPLSPASLACRSWILLSYTALKPALFSAICCS